MLDARVANANRRDKYIERACHVQNKTNQLSMINEACRFSRRIPKVVCHLCHLWLLTNNNNNCHILLNAQIQSQSKM